MNNLRAVSEQLNKDWNSGQIPAVAAAWIQPEQFELEFPPTTAQAEKQKTDINKPALFTDSRKQTLKHQHMKALQGNDVKVMFERFFFFPFQYLFKHGKL